ncbi:hypothetical protein D3C87_2148860 [compost metagenome]
MELFQFAGTVHEVELVNETRIGSGAAVGRAFHFPKKENASTGKLPTKMEMEMDTPAKYLA